MNEILLKIIELEETVEQYSNTNLVSIEIQGNLYFEILRYFKESNTRYTSPVFLTDTNIGKEFLFRGIKIINKDYKV